MSDEIYDYLTKVYYELEQEKIVSKQDHEDLKSISDLSVSRSSVRSVPYQFREDELLREFKDYVDKTYGMHYVDEDNTQALHGVIAAGHGIGFTLGNAMKYAFRYGKKNGYNRDDILKAIHYGLFALFVHDKEEKKRRNAIVPPGIYQV